MANRGSEETDEWVTGETPTLEETSQTEGESSTMDLVDEYLPYWATWNETYYGMAGGYLLLLGLFLVVSTLVTCWDSSHLTGTLDTVRNTPSTDTYASWQGAVDEAVNVRAEPPGRVRPFLYTGGFLVPGPAPEQLRDRLSRLHAYSAALVEYRFEHEGSRRASVLLDDELLWRGVSSGDDNGDPPMAEAGRTLRALARGEYDRALTMAEQARESAPEDVRLLRAHLQTALVAARTGVVETVADKLNEREFKTAYDQYLLVRSAPYHPDLSASSLSETFSSGESKNHLGVRIEEVATLRREGEAQKARDVGTNLLDGREETSGEKDASEPAFQLARLRNEIGLACLQVGDETCANTQFEAAIDRAPQRGSVYVPRIETLLGRTKLDDAEKRLDRAEARVGQHTELTVARARLQYLRSRWDEALATLDRVSEEREFAPILRAQILLELGEYQEASKVLGDVPSNSLEADRVQVLQLLASELASPEASEGADAMADLTDDSEDGVVLRAGARYYLERARSGAEGNPLEQARKILERASDRGPNAEMTNFLLCELHRLAEEWEDAGEACARVRRKHPEYLPGGLAAVRLRLQTQRPERAAYLAERLAGRFDDWDVATLRIRALVRSHELELAEDVLANWSDREVADSPEFAMLEGHLDFARANYAAAVEHYDRARESSAHGDEADLYYTHSLVRLGRFEKAEELLDALNDNPEWKGPAWAVFGELRRRQDEIHDALENFRFAKRHLDNDTAPRWRFSHLYGQLALTWRQHRDWDDRRVAINLEKGREQGDPRSPEIAYPYGLYLLAGYGNNSQPERAVTHLSRVVDLQPYNCGAVKALKKAYEETRDWAGRNDMRELVKKHCSEGD